MFTKLNLNDFKPMEKELNIELEYKCYDYEYLSSALIITVNNENIAVCDPENMKGVLREVLTHLGYNVKIKIKYD